MKRGEREQECLYQVREILRTKVCFLCVEKIEDIVSDIMSAKPNRHANDFPDFVFEGGFIEHFQVTAAKETTKGSSFRKKESEW